jgi:hypothetical protein
VLVQFWTYSCINWIRTVPYVRAWAQKYRDQGLVVIGAHAPIQELLAEAGARGLGQDLASVAGRGAEAPADWANLKSPETYLGSERSENQVSPDARLRLNHWSLGGNWTVQRQAVVLDGTNGKIAYRFHARDPNLVMAPGAQGGPVRFRVLIDGHAPGPAHGIDVDEQGNGVVAEPRMYQLIQQPCCTPGPSSSPWKETDISNGYAGVTTRIAASRRDVRHVFIMAGAVPNTGWLERSLVLNEKGFIKTGPDLSPEDLSAAAWPLARPPYLLETSRPGIFAVGDVRGGNIKRVAAAVGEGSIAIAFVHQVLQQ